MAQNSNRFGSELGFLDSWATVWHQELELRRRTYKDLMQQPDESLRLLHRRGGPLRIDRIGSVWVMGWWADRRPTTEEIQEILGFLKSSECRRWYLLWRPKKSVAPKPQLLMESTPPVGETWKFREHGVTFEARKDQGDAVGLFLDQRENRREVRQTSAGKKVLNLFSFTCGFSVMAAIGGAQRVVSVDLSKKYLDWGKKNFALNDLNFDNYEFFSMEALEFLKMSARRGETFDTVVCDPPSFSRSKKGSFKIDRDYVSLLEACQKVLEPRGTLWFSNNFEKWEPRAWQQRLRENVPGDWVARELQADFEGSQERSFQKTFVLKT